MGREPKHSEIPKEDREEEWRRDPFKKLKEKPGVKFKGWVRRPARE